MKRSMTLFFSILFFICLLAGNGQADEVVGSELVCNIDTVAVNWTSGLLRAVGRGVPPMASLEGEQGRTTALAEAVSDARGKLMTAIFSIPIHGGNTVSDLVENDGAAIGALREIVEMAEVIHQEFSTDGAVEVAVEMAMSGGFSQLVLPKVITQIESITPINTASDTSIPGLEGGQALDPDMSLYTGIIIDGRGLDIIPCMAPRVFDENGQEVFGPAYASREFAVQYGVSGYVPDMDAAVQDSRVADRPLTLKGVRIGDGEGSDIIVSNADAARLRSESENLALLRQCRVMIVLDPPDVEAEG